MVKPSQLYILLKAVTIRIVSVQGQQSLDTPSRYLATFLIKGRQRKGNRVVADHLIMNKVVLGYMVLVAFFK